MPEPDYEVEPEHVPMRGDAVEKWIKAKRDALEVRDWRSPEWHALDDLLDEYRLRADTGLTLADDLSETGQYGTDYATMERDLGVLLAQLERNRIQFQSRPSPGFRDERLHLRNPHAAHRVVTAAVVCVCDHVQPDTTCAAHGVPLLLDATAKTTVCECPPPL